jgi:hypothetical protein
LKEREKPVPLLLANDSLAQQEVKGWTIAPSAWQDNIAVTLAVHDIAYPVALPMHKNRSDTALNCESAIL